MSDLKKPKRPPQPDSVEGAGADVVEIAWDDGEISRITARALRGNCMCAECVEEMSGRRRVGVEDVPVDVTAQRFERVGNYAIRVYWSDGHSTGIYPYDKLRELGREGGPDGPEDPDGDEPSTEGR